MGKFLCQFCNSPSGRFGWNANKLNKQPKFNDNASVQLETDARAWSKQSEPNPFQIIRPVFMFTPCHAELMEVSQSIPSVQIILNLL